MAMVFFLAQDGETKVSLDSEASISVSLPSTVAKSSTMSGIAVSDDVIEGNAVISVQGRVTYSKLTSQNSNLNPLEFQEAIQYSRRNRTRFTLNVKEDKQALLQSYEDCCISSVDISVDKFSDTITVNMVFEQVFVSEAARKTDLAPISSEEAKTTTAKTKDKGNVTKGEVDKSGVKKILDYFSNPKENEVPEEL